MTSPIWQKIIKRLNEKEVRYVLVGGAALIVHGLPRGTLDIDIYVPANQVTLEKLFQIADEVSLDTGQRDILKIRHLPGLFANQWICFSDKGQDVLDVFFATEKEFGILYRNSEQKKDKNLSVRVASLNAIAAMKEASHRALDRADLALIREVKRKKRGILHPQRLRPHLP